MKKLTTLLLVLFSFVQMQAQETIKVGDENTIKCTGKFITEVQNYYLDGKPDSKSRAFVDVQKDSLVFFTALVDDGRNNQVVFKNIVAKKDIDQGDWGFAVEATKENGASFYILKITTTNEESLVSEAKYAHDEIKKNEATNRVHIYFAADKEADAKAWAEKLKKSIQ